MLRFINISKRLKIVFNTVAETLPGLASILGILTLLIYIYSVIGVQLFSTIKRNTEFTEVFNFESFPTAALSLLALGLGDSGPKVMYSAIRTYSIEF